MQNSILQEEKWLSKELIKMLFWACRKNKHGSSQNKSKFNMEAVKTRQNCVKNNLCKYLVC